MLDFYRLQQLANQRGLLRDKYIYRVLPEPPTPRVEGSRDLDSPGPRPKHVSRHAFRQRLPIAKYGPFLEMHWENDLAARPEDTVETEPPKEQPSPLTPEGPRKTTTTPFRTPLQPQRRLIPVTTSQLTPQKKGHTWTPTQKSRSPKNTPWTPTILCATTSVPGFLSK